LFDAAVWKSNIDHHFIVFAFGRAKVKIFILIFVRLIKLFTMDEDFFEEPQIDENELKRRKEKRMTFWGTSSSDGLYLALVSIAILALSYFITLPGWIGVILSLAKLVASIWLLAHFMKQYCRSIGKATYGQAFGFGFMTTVFSSILCAAFTFLVMQYLKPDLLQQSMATAMQQYQGQSAEMASALEQFMDMYGGRLPQLMFVIYLIWYIMIGLVASLCIASAVKTVSSPAENEDF
jgi:hypothetical protein